MNNSCFGKTMENVRKRINFRLISSNEKAEAIRNTRIKLTIFNENLVGVHLCKQEVVLNKPIYIGGCVLDMSKYLMYDFHYNKIMKHFKRENIDLLMTDTDSLCYHIRNQDPFEYMKNNKELFDLSGYNKNNELYNETNKKVIGKFKDESPENQIIEFVGLRSKLYAYKTDDEADHKKCTGVKKCVVKNILFEQYKNTLLNRQILNVKQNVFRSFIHQVYTEEVEKVGLSYSDDKMHIANNNIICYSHGYYKIKK